jgi:putative ABC transport system ATP-binding protein
MSSAPPVSLQDVSYFYGKGNLRKQTLFDINLEVDAGEIVILTGPSGSGKTTLLSLIGALRSSQLGSLVLLGQELHRCTEKQRARIRKQIGFIFQHHNLLESLSVAQNIQMALELSRPKKRGPWPERIRDVLGQVGMVEHMYSFPRKLSGGQKQRVGIARALINHPKVILADEPTASLDKQSGRDVVELITRLSRDDRAAVILVTHDNRILDIADRILHLEDGHIKRLKDAVGDNTSRLLNILARHEPGAVSYLTTFALALTRVATADQVITEEEDSEIRRILHEVTHMSSGEVELILELSRSHLNKGSLDRLEPGLFRTALQAVAAADGVVSPEEEHEIRLILSELGFD